MFYYSRFMRHPKDGIREQALNILCNIASNEEGIEMVFDQFSKDDIIGAVADVLDSENEDDDVVCQVRRSAITLVQAPLSNSCLIRPFMFSPTSRMAGLRIKITSSRTLVCFPPYACA